MIRRAAGSIVGVLLLAPALAAQAPGGSLRTEPAVLRARAALVAPAPGAVLARSAELATVAAPNRRRQGVVLMLVGAAGIVTGIIVDESIVTIAGAGVAGFGLYLYLDSGGQVGLRVPVP